MLDISTEMKREISNDNRNFLPFLEITLKDGTALKLEKEDIWENSFKVEDATSENDKFTIGAAVTGKLTVTISNIYDQFSEYDFSDANVIAYVGMQLNTLEKIRIGTYKVDEPSYDGSTISLSCVDNMALFNKPYSMSKLKYPATLGVIISDVCTCCGVPLVSANFDNNGYVVQERPTDDVLIFGDVVAMVAQIAGCWAKMDAYGRLQLDWYKMSAFEKNANLDGGVFDKETPFATGDTADGGNFTNYNSGDEQDGGIFDDLKQYHHIYSMRSFNASTDDVVITGVRVTEEFDETDTDKKGSCFLGNEGYVIDISGNALIQKGAAQVVATFLYDKIGGMQFRPVEVECLANPIIEAGDIAYVTDRKQNTYQIFISNRTFNLGGSESISCDAETPLKNSTKTFSNMTKAIVKARNEAKAQISNYDLAVQQLTNLMTQSFGVFKSEEVLEDGSTVYYMHNKPERATSSTIWKMTADAFAVSTDGGKTWAAGMDASGNAVVNVLSAVGINFDWARGGTMSLGGPNNGNGVMKLYDASGNVIATIDTAGFKAMHTDGSYTMMGPAGMQHHDTAGETDYHYLMHSGTYIFSGTFNGKWSSDIQLPGTFKGKNFKVTVQFAGMVPREEYNDVLSSLALDTSTNQANGTFKIMCRCNSFSLEQRTGPDGSLLNQLTDPKSVTVSYLVIA